MDKKHTFALVDGSVTYTGKDAEGFYSTALLTGDSKSLIRAVPNVKDKIKLASLDMGDFLQADECELEESGDYTLDQKTLQVCDLGFKIKFCGKDWESNYLSELLRPGSNVEENYPNGVIDYIFEQIALNISKQTENLMWQGDTAGSPASLCDGFQKKFLADATVVDVAVDGTKLHGATTVIGELTRIYNAIPDTIRDTGKVVMFVNKATAAAYKLALVAANPALVGYNQGDYKLQFIDIPIVVAPGLGNYKAVCCDPMNLWYGFDLLNEENQVEFVTDPLNKRVNYAIGAFKIGFEYGVGSEIVYYN
jgi:hypothetical protein